MEKTLEQMTEEEIEQEMFRQGWVKLPYPAIPEWQRPRFPEGTECLFQNPRNWLMEQEDKEESQFPD